MLFIPGLGYGTWSWARQMNEVSSVATVLLMDNRGAGRSDKPEGPYSINQLADDAHAVLAQRSALPAAHRRVVDGRIRRSKPGVAPPRRSSLPDTDRDHQRRAG